MGRPRPWYGRVRRASSGAPRHGGPGGRPFTPRGPLTWGGGSPCSSPHAGRDTPTRTSGWGAGAVGRKGQETRAEVDKPVTGSHLPKPTEKLLFLFLSRTDPGSCTSPSPWGGGGWGAGEAVWIVACFSSKLEVQTIALCSVSLGRITWAPGSCSPFPAPTGPVRWLVSAAAEGR